MLIHRLKLFVPASVVVLSIVKIAGGAELPTELLDCRPLTSAVERLDCYDQLVDAHAASPSQAAKPETTENPAPLAPAAAAAATAASEPVLSSRPELSQEDLFGQGETEMRKSVQEATDAEEIDRIEAIIVDVYKSKSGKAVITLDNGQVWKQSDGSRTHLSVDDTVTIRRRSFGSYTLFNKKNSIRVKRIS
jgi:hypothetical protein